MSPTTRFVLTSLLLAMGALLSACHSGSSFVMPSMTTAADTKLAPGVQQIPLALTVDKQTATGLAFVPNAVARAQRKPLHLITFCHGHGEQADDFIDILSQLAADTGAVVVAMDYRNAPGNQPGDWNMERGYQDTVAATKWAEQRFPSIQTSDIWGWSMGGLVSGMAVAYQPNLYRYWVASFPATDIVEADVLFTALQALGIKKSDATQIENDIGCSLLACPAQYIARSPSLLAYKMHPKRAILLHGFLDTTSPYQQSLEMFTTLVANGVPVSLYSVLTQTDNGKPAIAGHGRGSIVASIAGKVVRRLLKGTEPVGQPVSLYLIDQTLGINTGPGGK